jgi:hypothetical protein
VNQIDPNFDWVSARAKCSPVSAFETLGEQIKTDVEKRNVLLNAMELQYAVQFKIATGSGAFRVARIRMEEMLQSATFSQTNDGIKVAYSSAMNLPPIEATLTLADDQECKLNITGGRELYFWQFRRLALEPVLFGPVEWWK